MYGIVPFIPTEGPPAATAAKAYSICTSLPEGLNQKSIAIINLALIAITALPYLMITFDDRYSLGSAKNTYLNVVKLKLYLSAIFQPHYISKEIKKIKVENG